MGRAALESGVNMLDAFIIEEIKRREAEREQKERQRPKLEIPRRDNYDDDDDVERDDAAEKPQRGVVVIDL